jgi:hypothetical protein
MARKTLLSTYYTFNPTTRTIVIPQAVPRERLVLITNVMTDTVVYNFSDNNLKATAYTIATDALGNTTTTVTLQYNTAAMSASDELQILIDEYDEKFSPSEVYTDPVNKIRTSQPQALIDTDFEYSTQATKWESLAMIDNRPFAYYNVNSPLLITDVTATNASRTITVTATSGAPAAGTAVYILDTTYAGADGLYIVDTSNGSTSFTYTARLRYTGTTGSIFVSGITSGYTGSIYTGASIAMSGITYSSTAVTVTTTYPHGLAVGNEIALTGTSASTNAPNGSWTVATVTSPTSFVFYATNAPTGSITGGTLYCRPTGGFNHRAFDGGVQFSTNAQSHNQQMIRQTRRYFRYQSGKGIQVSTGTLLKPSINVDSITSSGTTVTVVTKLPHNLNPGVGITIARCNETAYNGAFTVATVIDPYKFTYTSLSAPSAATASGNYVLSVTTWNGATTRVGVFDNQNGIFFEFDGQTLYAVRRSSTYQLSGSASVTANSSTVTGITLNGVTTNFSKQLQPGDFIVIKGMSYRVDTIASDTSMTIVPPYRGTTVGNVTISKTVDLRIPQSQWNIDRADGTGPSGYNLDLSRMQMFYMDYSWYGAGFIRWGFRGATGDCIYCHKLINNNINYDAYMRSGNLPARYETNTFAKMAILTSTCSSSDTSINVTDHATWPTAGTIWVHNGSQSEFINYTGKSQVASLTGTTTLGSFNISMTNTSGVVVGQYVTGTGIPYGTTVQSIVSNTSVTLSVLPTFAVTSGTFLFGPTLTGLTRGQGGGSLTFTTTTGSPVITGASTSGIQVGQYVIGTGIPPNAYVTSIVTNTSVSLSEAATASGSVSLIFPPMGQTAQTFTYSATAPTAVELHAPEFAPTISHWGTSVIMDGRFDDDKSFVFTRGMTTTVSVTNGNNNAIMSFRIAPTVSNGVTSSILGTREIINRMQMVLRNMDLFSNGQFLITLVLNGVVSSATPNWASQGGSSLAQYITHSAGTTLSGGEVVYGFFLNTAGGTNYTTTSVELNLLRDMGTSILGGGAAAGNTAIYPDGPDVITVMAQNIGSGAANIFGRVSWTEAQA